VPHALLRQGLADLRGRRLQSFQLMLLAAVAAFTATLAVSVQIDGSARWDRLFAAANGAHVEFLAGDTSVDFTPIVQSEGVTETAGPYPVVRDMALVQDPVKTNLWLVGVAADPPQVDRPLLTAGAWLAAGRDDQIVLDTTFAGELDITVGQRVEVLSAQGRVPLEVAGLALGATQAYPVRPPLGYVRPVALAKVAPERTWESSLHVRLANPQDSGAFRERAATRLPTGVLVFDQDWQVSRDDVLAANQFSLVFIRAFSLFALIAVGLVVANVSNALILARFREIGLLKAIGFTPWQITLLFLLEHLGLGLIAALAGIAVGVVLTPIFLSPVFLQTTPSLLPALAPPIDPVALAGVLLGLELVVGLFTLLPAWRGGRIEAVQAIKIGPTAVERRPSRLAGLARRLGMPLAIVLGMKDAFARPGRALFTIAGLVLTFTTATVVLSVAATLETALADPLTYGPPGEMSVRRVFRSDAEVRQILAAQPEVHDYLSYLLLPARAADQPVSVAVVAVATPIEHIHINIPEGRMFAMPGEAVVSQLVLRQLHVKVGDDLRLSVQNRPLTLRIVGRYAGALDISPIVLYSMATFHEQVDAAAEPIDYALALAPGTNLLALRAALLHASDDQLGVFIPRLSLRGFGWVYPMLIALISSLLVIGLINILNTTLLGVQERVRELGILKAVGLTPGQVSVSVVAGMSVLALLAVLISIPLGIAIVYALWSYAYQQLGGGSGIVLPVNWLWMGLLLPGAVLVALLGSALPARHAGRIPVVEALRYE